MSESRVHVHDNLESAYMAVRKSIAEKEARAATDAMHGFAREPLLVESEKLPESPPGTGSRRGTVTPACPPNRRVCDAKRHSFRAQALIKVIDEAAEPSRRRLLEACDCVLSGDRAGFAAAMKRALTARSLKVVEWHRGAMVADLLQSGGRNHEEETEDEED